jgi:hypothetical protein
MNEPDPASSAIPPRLPRTRARRLWSVAFSGLLVLLAISSYFVIRRLGGRWQSGYEGTAMASLRADFQPEQPKPGWGYYWNANGPIGDPGGYAQLRWNGKLYAAAEPTQYPAPAPARYLRLTRGSGHPGQGTSQGREVGNDEERAVIMAFTVPQAGHYRIANSYLSRQVGPRSGNVHLQVFVNDQEMGPDLYCRSREGIAFDRDLGLLAAGATIYVSVGPDETDVDDSFDLDFSITR